MSDKKGKFSIPNDEPEDSLFDSIRQAFHCPEFRISLSGISLEEWLAMKDEEPKAPKERMTIDMKALSELLASLATCLWDIERKLKPVDGIEPDRKQKMAYRRAEKAIEVLKQHGVAIKDPTGERYPQGGENWIKPIQFQPTPGITYEKIVETVAPVVYFNNMLIQRGEVFVAVPEPVNVAVSTTAKKAEKKPRKTVTKAKSGKVSKTRGKAVETDKPEIVPQEMSAEIQPEVTVTEEIPEPVQPVTSHDNSIEPVAVQGDGLKGESTTVEEANAENSDTKN
jgi:hypothetical protein